MQDKTELRGLVDTSLAQALDALAHADGQNDKLRIVLCGHAGEHDELLTSGWFLSSWIARKGYALSDEAVTNSASETLWCSTHCIRANAGNFDLFSEAA